jgi:hypothetical protein
MYNENIYKQEELPSSRIELLEKLLFMNNQTLALPEFEKFQKTTQGYVPLVLPYNSVAELSKYFEGKDIEEVRQAVLTAITLYKNFSGTRPSVRFQPKPRKKPHIKKY